MLYRLTRPIYQDMILIQNQQQLFLRIYCNSLCFLGSVVLFCRRERGIASSQSSGQQVLIKKHSSWPEAPQACVVPGSKSALCLLTRPEQSQAHRCRQLRGCTTLEAKGKTSKNSRLELCASKSYLCKGFFCLPITVVRTQGSHQQGGVLLGI